MTTQLVPPFVGFRFNAKNVKYVLFGLVILVGVLVVFAIAAPANNLNPGIHIDVEGVWETGFQVNVAGFTFICNSDNASLDSQRYTAFQKKDPGDNCADSNKLTSMFKSLLGKLWNKEAISQDDYELLFGNARVVVDKVLEMVATHKTL